MQVIHSGQFQRMLPEKGRGFLAYAMDDLLAAPSLLDTLDVVAQRFFGVYGMIGGLDEVVENRVPLGEVYEIAAGFRGDTKEFVQCLDTAFKRARSAKAGHDYKTGTPLLTYFRSKGLQWHTIILSTCNEGLIPHEKALVEEERRLFYVAMTRASSNLIVSYVESACGCRVPPSRFLYEAGLLARPEGKRKKKRAKPRGSTKTARSGAGVASSADGYVASASSDVFHSPICGAAAKIAEEKVVRYGKREEAVQAGKRPCSRCLP